VAIKEAQKITREGGRKVSILRVIGEGKKMGLEIHFRRSVQFSPTYKRAKNEGRGRLQPVDWSTKTLDVRALRHCGGE